MRGWIKVWASIFKSYKVNQLELGERWIYLGLLMLAKNETDPGFLVNEKDEPLSSNQIAFELGIQRPSSVDKVLLKCQSIGLITPIKEKLFLINWSLKQNWKPKSPLMKDSSEETGDTKVKGECETSDPQEVKKYRSKEVKNTNTTSCEAKRVCEYFMESIKQIKPDFKFTDIPNWEKEVDRMIRIDKRMPERILAVIDWIRKDEFWRTNILSIDKLRKQFDRIELKMGRGRTGGSTKYIGVKGINWK